MAQTDSNVLVGPCTAWHSAYVANAGAGTFTEFGHTSAACEIAKEAEYYEPESEQSLGPVTSRIQKLSFTLKVPTMEASVDNLRIALEQPSGNVSGTGANKTIGVGDPEVEYFQLKLEGVGPGTTGVRTWLCWKCKVIAMEPILIGRNQFQGYNLTFRIYRDASVVTNPEVKGLFYQQVDT